MRALFIVCALAVTAHAQQLPCEACARGEDTLEQLGEAGELLRDETGALAAIGVEPGGTIRTQQQARLVATLGTHHDAISEAVGPLSDDQLADVAAALCSAPDGHCKVSVAAALACLAGRCTVEREEERLFPPPPPPPHTCDPYVKHITSPAFGLGLDWGEGRHVDRSPVDGRAWSIGFLARERLSRRFGLVERVDRSTGRDAAIDGNGDGRDDVATGPVTRVSVLAGPAVMFGVHHGDATTFAQLDLLGGYQWSLSQPSEDGPVAGFDLQYSLEVVRAGVRVTQGFGDAKDARAVLAHVGVVVGAGPNFDYAAGCGRDDKDASKLALALDIPLFGYGLTSALDYSVPGFGLEAAYHVSHYVDALAHADVMVFPNGDRERALYQTTLAGARFDLLAPKRSSELRTGFFTTLMAGYSFAATTEPTKAGSGPVGEASVGWGAEGDDGFVYLRLHGRVGLTPDNIDASAMFLSGGVELRMDRRQWKDRL
jgi:hypothetical protein